MLSDIMNLIDYPPFLRGFGLSYMPIYCPRRYTLCLVQQSYWPFIKMLMTYTRPRMRVYNHAIKRVLFVHEMHSAKYHPINEARMNFLKYYKIIVQYPWMDTSQYRGNVLCIDSSWLVTRFQAVYRKKYGSFYGGYFNWRYLYTRRRKPMRPSRIRSGYYSDVSKLGALSPFFRKC